MKSRYDDGALGHILVLVTALAAASCDNDPLDPPSYAASASLEVRSVTLGRLPGDGYMLQQNGDSIGWLDPTGSVSFADLMPGPATISVASDDHYCISQGDEAREVELESGTLASVTFDFVCDPLSRINGASLESIQASGLRDYVFDLAADSMLGRRTGTPQIEQAASYIAASFAASGLQPPGSGEYIDWWTRDSGFAGPNVIGWIPGSDPDLNGEYVLFVAHFDHIGYRSGYYPDSVRNGANDNASGTASLLALAKAFALLDPAPSRSAVFLAVSGEEEGLHGSQAYAEQPAFPLGATHQVLNFDMVGKPIYHWSWDKSRYWVKSTEDSEYAPLAADLVRFVGLDEFDLRLGESITRSDGRTFADLGIPVVDFFSGTDEEYHTFDDEPELLDYEFQERFTRLAFILAVEIASWADE